MPWKVKRMLLNTFFGYHLHPKAYIGFSWIFPNHLAMEESAHINHFTVAIHLDEIIMKKEATISRSNWITGFSSKKKSPHFSHDLNRKSQLLMGIGAAITKKHHMQNDLPKKIFFCGNEIEVVKSFLLLGVTIDDKLNFSHHVSNIRLKVNKRLFSIHKLFQSQFRFGLVLFKF